jgi:protein TonB
LQPGDFVATRAHDESAATLHGLSAGERVASPLADADQTNVIPFSRSRRPALPPLTVQRADRPAPPSRAPDRSAGVLAAASILLHSLLLLGLWQTPVPMASIGVEAITMEEVLGADTLAGLAATPSENEVQASAPGEAAKLEEKVAEQEQIKTPEQRDVRPEETRQQRQITELREVKPQETRPLEIVAEVGEVALEEMPPETPQEILTEIPVTVEAQPDRPQEVKPVARPKPKRQSTAAANPSMPSTASSGIGRGRSDATSNYPGMVVAHLARHKQYPAAARNSGAQGTGSVTFAMDGSGRVTSASVSKSTGSPALDQELTAMVRRASPFPAPPGGQGRSFTAPVTFRIK